MDPAKLARAALKDVNVYESPRGDGLWLNANEYPESVPYALDTADKLNFYPEMQSSRLRALYARYSGLAPENILITRGGDEAISTMVRTFCEAGRDAVLINPPTYTMYQAFAGIQGALKVNCVTLEKNGFAIDPEAIAANLDGVKTVFICSPNNPTGQAIDLNAVRTVLEAAKDRAMVVVDEAYSEFCPELSVTGWIRDYPNLVVIRTLSKAFALAGLRCGFLLAQKEVIECLQKTLDPFAVPVPVEDIACQALSDENLLAMKKRVAFLQENREYFCRAVRNLPQVDKVFPSITNFVLIRFKNADEVFEALKKENIFIRDQQYMPGLKGCLRVSIGTKKEMDEVLRVIRSVPVR